MKKALYIFASIILLLFLASWAFLNYFAGDLLNSKIIPKLTAAARIATHGRFALTLGHISYSHGDVSCTSFVLDRVRYDSAEDGMVVKKITIDTIYFTGVSWWDIVWGKPLDMNSLQMNSPKLYMIDASKETSSRDVIGDSLRQFPSPHKKSPIISFDSIVLRDISVFLPSDSLPVDAPSFQNITVKLSDFSFNSESIKQEPLLYSKRVDFSLPLANHVTADSFYTIRFRNLRGSLSDSLLTIDSFSYIPNYTEDVYAAKHKVATAAIDFRCTKLRFQGINFTKLFAGKCIEVRKLEAGSWYIDSYLDRRRPANLHPADAPMPNDLVRTLPIKLNIDSLILNDGKIRVRERAPGSLVPGLLFFDRTRIAATPICSDSLNKEFGQTTIISVSAYFLGQALLSATALYPLTNKSFDLRINAAITGFDTRKLNAWLIPFERLEVTSGTVVSGNIDMTIKSGVATTTVTPRYHDFSMKVLSKDPKEGTSAGILEGIKSFFANTFVLKSNNLAEDGKPAKSGTATIRRTKDEEFMQFLWFSLRRSLGNIVGGFK